MSACARRRYGGQRDACCRGLLGFLRDVVIAAVLGAGALADAFFVALQIPNLFRRLLAEGALNAAFVPLWLAPPAGRRRARRAPVQRGCAGHARHRTRRDRGAVRAVRAGGGRLLAPGFCGEPYLLAVYFLRLAAPYVALAGLVAVMAATLNAAGRVGAAAYGTSCSTSC